MSLLDDSRQLHESDSGDCDSMSDLAKNLRNEGQYFRILFYVFGALTFLCLVVGISVFLGRRLKPVPPWYWARRHSWSPAKFFSDVYKQEVDVTYEFREAMQKLMNATTDPGSMGKGRDGDWATHKGFEVIKVTRIEDGRLWSRYYESRSRVSRWKQDLLDKGLIQSELVADVRAAVKLIEDANATTVHHLGDFLNLDVDRCEVMLFHGSPGPGARNKAGEVMYHSEERSPLGVIKRQGFDDRLGNVSGMLGSGTYFANKASKADCYAGRYNSMTDGYTSVGETATMFLSRVVMGTPYLTRKSLEQLRRPPCLQGHFDVNLMFRKVAIGEPWAEKAGIKFDICDHPRFDSVISDEYIDGDQKLYREFVIYEQQSYPEFCITYKRLAAMPTASDFNFSASARLLPTASVGKPVGRIKSMESGKPRIKNMETE